MRILQIITRVNRGGTARWLDVLINGLKAVEVDCLLAAGLVQGDEKEDESFQKYSGIRVNGLGRTISIFDDVKALFQLRRIIRKVKPDLINTHTSKAGALGRLAAIGLGKDRPAAVHTFHGHLLYGYFGPIKRNFVIVVERILSKFTDLYISSGSIVRDDLLSEGVGIKSKYRVIKPGVEDFTVVSKNQIRKQLGISDDAVVVGWLGRMVSVKRPGMAIEIARQLPTLVFLMAGDGELLEQSKVVAPPNVIFTGWSTPAEIWGASDIALLTSENEAQPISLVEAGYAKLPSVAIGVGSISEVITHDLTGYLGENIHDLVKYLKLLSEDSTKRELFGNSARKKMLEEFSVTSFIRNHISVYEDALEIHQK